RPELHAEAARLYHGRARRSRHALLLRSDGIRRDHNPDMTWNIATRSKMVTTRLGKLAVRVDGGADMAPMLLCQRFRGTLEDWDPEFISRLAVGRQIIRFDSAGIGESEGETPNAVVAMAENRSCSA